MQTHDTPEKSYDLERLIFFTDGVFAIVITLLVIDLRPPPNWDRTFSGLLAAEGHPLLAYFVSFLAAGVYWNAHRRIFARVVRFHGGLVAVNLVFLCLVVLFPFAAELIFESGPHGEPFAIYLSLVAAIGAAQALMWGFAAFVAKVVDPAMDQRERWMVLAIILLASALVAGGAAAAWAGMSPANWIWLFPILAAANLAARRRLLAPRKTQPSG
jgi:uncharacterized membrane protein